MRDKAFFDTNILVYALATETLKTEVAENLLQTGGTISVQVLNELAHVALRKLRMPWHQVVDALSTIRELCPNPAALDIDTHDLALRLASRYSFTIYDSLVLAAALKSNCTILYSEDFQHGQRIENRLTILNPFTHQKAPVPSR